MCIVKRPVFNVTVAVEKKTFTVVEDNVLCEFIWASIYDIFYEKFVCVFCNVISINPELIKIADIVIN